MITLGAGTADITTDIGDTDAVGTTLGTSTARTATPTSTALNTTEDVWYVQTEVLHRCVRVTEENLLQQAAQKYHATLRQTVPHPVLSEINTTNVSVILP